MNFATDALCYGAVALNMLAMSRTSLVELRVLSIVANLLLATYALCIDGHALAVSAGLIIAVHIIAFRRPRAQLGEANGTRLRLEDCRLHGCAVELEREEQAQGADPLGARDKNHFAPELLAQDAVASQRR